MNKRKALALVLALVLALALLPRAAVAADNGEPGSYIYTSTTGDFIVENGVLKKYVGMEEEVTTPAGVYEIKAEAFMGRDDITTIRVGERTRVITINGCANLTTLILPEGVTSVDTFNCPKLTTVNFPSTLKKLHLYECQVSELELPEGIESVCCYSDKLTQVELPGTTRSYTVYGQGLTKVILDEGIPVLDSLAPSPNLTTVVIPSSVKNVSSYYHINPDPWLKAYGDRLIVNGVFMMYFGFDPVVVVPEGVTAIANHAFARTNPQTERKQPV